ncbi:MAG: molybdopterin molybdotransferase MoeA [Bacillota bacterium]
MDFRPLKLLSVTEATAAYADRLPAREPSVEAVPLTAALGRVLAEAVTAGEDVPGFDRSTVDGYAVRAADTFGASEALPALLTVVGDVRMGAAAGLTVRAGQTARVPTGGMLPAGADAVVMLEYAEELDTTTIAAQRPVGPGENVLTRGEDMAAGAAVLARGRALRPQEIGALAGIGHTVVKVYRRPVVAVISSGDEIIPPGRMPGSGEIRDINAYALAAMAEEAGALPVIVGIIRDDYEALLAAVHGSLAGRVGAATGPGTGAGPADAVVVSGGSSVGARDATARVIAAVGPPGVIVHGVAVKPGKPTILGLAAGDPPRPVFGLPGHPASAMVVFDLFVRPVLRRLAGLAAEAGPTPVVRVRLAENVASSPAREEYVRVRLVMGPDGFRAHPVLGKSGLITTLVQADGLLRVPLGRQGYEAGDEVEVLPFRS